MKNLIAALLLAMVATSAMAQSKFTVKGVIIEKGTNEAIPSATVRILSLPDSSMVAGAATATNGSFTIKDVKKGKYAIKVTYIGYNDHVLPLDLTKAKDKTYDAGYITLAEDSKLLKDAVVTAAAAQVQVVGDSVVFNAAAYRTPEGSMLEDLVKKLPGATMDEDGTIKINGKTVNKILVDGKEFFLNDKEMALKNIPTNIIDKLKTYDRKSDLARVTGIDDGEEETVLDLSLKKGMNQGWFGNLDLAGGTQHRYSGRANLNRFLDGQQYSFIGNANNTGNMGFGGGGGRGWGGMGGRGFGGGGGLRSNKDVGFNFATGNDIIEVGGNVRYRYNGSDSQSETNTENYISTKTNYSTSKSASQSSNYNLNADFRMEWKPDSMTNIIFRPSGSISRNRSMSDSRNATYNQNPYENDYGTFSDPLSYLDRTSSLLDSILVNSNVSRSQSYSLNKNLNGELQVNRRLSNNGRNITLRATGALSSSESKSLSASQVKYATGAATDKNNNRYSTTPGKSHNYSLQLTYSEPIADRTYLQFSYRFNYGYNKSDRSTGIFDSYDQVTYTSIREALDRNRYNVAGAIDELISKGYEPNYTDPEAVKLAQFQEYRNYDHTATISFRKVTDMYNFSVGLDFLPQHSTLNYVYMGQNYPEVKRTVYNFAPSVDFRYNFDKQTQFRINYRSRTSQPSMTNLLDITDDSNPLNITKGNPGLKPSLNHNFNLNYNTFQMETMRSFFVYGGGGFTQNSISNRTYYNDETGVRTTKPENINGNWNANVGFGYNQSFGPENLFSINSNTNGGYNHQVSYVDETKYENDKASTNSLNVGQRLSLTYRKNWFDASINGNVNYQHTRNSMITSNNRDTWNFSYGAEFNFIFDWGTSLSTDISESSRRGYSSAEMNTNELLWNIQVSQSFLKGKALTVSLQWNDVLGQQSNISRTISAMSMSDSRTNAIYSYGMIHIIYKLNIFGGKRGGQDNPFGQFGRGGGFPGGGMPMGGGGRPTGGFGGGGFGGGRMR